MNNKLLQTFEPFVNITNSIKEPLKISSQCLFGEVLKVHSIIDNWVFGTLLADNYQGWLELNKFSSKVLSTNYNVCTIRSFLMTKPDQKSEIISYLPMCSQLSVEGIEEGWAKIILNDKFGYVPKSHIQKNQIFTDDWVKIAETFLGVPYRWGGRDSIGVDCSALVQLSLSFKGRMIPRDSLDQYKFFKKRSVYSIKNNLENRQLNRGDLIYWNGHIAIVKNETHIIHASAYHGKVVEEKIDKALKRIKLKPKFITYNESS